MFNPNDYKESAGGGGQKTLEPGTVYARIVNIEMSAPPFDAEVRQITVTLEGQPEGEGFQGMAVDKNNPSMGTYEGKIGWVRNGQWGWKTFEYEGRTIERDQQIFEWITSLAKQMGKYEALVASGESAETIEEYVQLVSSYLIDPDNWGFFTIAAEEYKNDKGYPAHRLFFPKKKGKQFPFAQSDDPENFPDTLLRYDKAVHYLVKGEKPAAAAPAAPATPGFNAGGAPKTGGLRL